MKNIEHKEPPDRLDALTKSALIIEGFDEASNALVELRNLDGLRARDVALKVLNEKIGDTFYQALAFEILYAASAYDAIAYIEKKAKEESIYVLGAMLTAVAEDVGDHDRRDEVSKAVSLLRRVLALKSAEDLREISAKVTWFVDSVRDF